VVDAVASVQIPLQPIRPYRPVSVSRRSIRIRPTTSSAVHPQQMTVLFNNTSTPYITSTQCIHTLRTIATINSHYVVMRHYEVLFFVLYNETTGDWLRTGRSGDFLHTYRPALGPIQPPVQWVPGLYRG
jgi:hypothetical protein